MQKAIIETDKGTMVAELYDDAAPNTVANFVGLASGTKEWKDPKTGQKVKRPYFDGLRFHRVIADFVIQGGDPLTAHESEKSRWGTGGPGFHIECETKGAKQVHDRGSLSMAHAGLNTGGSQFFICHNARNASHLNGKHTVFGRVVEGLDVIDKIKAGDVIKSVRIENANANASA